MMSTVPAFSFSEPGLVNQLSDFQTGFTPWDLDCSDLFSLIQSSLEPVMPNPWSGESETGSVGNNTGSGSEEYCIGSVRINPGFYDIKSGSDESCIGSIKTNSGSDDSNCFHGVTSPQSDELNSENTRIPINATNHNRKKLNRTRPVSQVTDEHERKRKRMESNRESAKRSRMRKQRHIEILRDEVNRLGLEKRELVNRLRTVLYHIEQISTDNNLLLSEQEILRRRFSEMRQFLILRQLQSQQRW